MSGGQDCSCGPDKCDCFGSHRETPKNNEPDNLEVMTRSEHTKNYDWYLQIAKEVSKRSKCLSRKIGAVLVTPDGTIIGTGFNGPPRGVPHCDDPVRFDWIVEQLKQTKVGRVDEFLKGNGWGVKCPRRIMKLKSGEGLEFCPAAHAERNALINSAREGIRTKDCTMVMNCPLPCQECSKEIINAGIVKIVCLEGPDYDAGSRWLLNQAGIEIITKLKEDPK
jgi:dCMP deaminase